MVSAIVFLFRLYSYLFHLILSLFLIGISLVAISSGNALELGMLPWIGPATNRWVLGLGIVGFGSVFLAATRTLRWVFPLWALAALILIVRGFFLTPYVFGGGDAFRTASSLAVGALMAFLGSLSVFRSRRPRRHEL